MSTSPLPTPYPLQHGRVELVAIDRSRNILRRYSVEISQDLFGAHIVETAWGRIGSWSAAKRVSFDDRSAAERTVATNLRRRATAAGRIGVAYRAVTP